MMDFSIGDMVTWSQHNGDWIIVAIHEYNLTIMCSGEKHIALKSQMTRK